VLEHAHGKIAFGPRDALDFRQGDQFNVVVPADLDQFGGQNSHGAVIGRKGLVQLGHDPSNTGRLFNHVNEKSRIGQVKGRLYAADAPADNHDGPLYFFLERTFFPFLCHSLTFLKDPSDMADSPYHTHQNGNKGVAPSIPFLGDGKSLAGRLCIVKFYQASRSNRL
jgi:hypothetical protein